MTSPPKNKIDPSVLVPGDWIEVTRNKLRKVYYVIQNFPSQRRIWLGQVGSRARTSLSHAEVTRYNPTHLARTQKHWWYQWFGVGGKCCPYKQPPFMHD